MNTAEQKTALILTRVSSSKQGDGNGLKTQLEACTQCCNSYNFEIVKVVSIVESGATLVRTKFEKEVLEFCKNNKTDYIVFYSIDRLTRQGNNIYLDYKHKLKAYGTQLKDVMGIIQPQTNVFSGFDYDYDWLHEAPSELPEMFSATYASTERKTILRRLILPEIMLTQEGYWCRVAPYGYQNRRITDSNGKKKPFLEYHPTESNFIRQMFEMKASGEYTDEEIVRNINNSGYATRNYTYKFSNDGYEQLRGNNKLTVKSLRSYLRKPIYAGFIHSKWTDFKLVKAQFNGIVSIDDYNKANRGKSVIVEEGNNYTLKKAESPTGTVRNKKNPAFIYKNIVRCPMCKDKMLKASNSTGGSGKKYGYYFCDRKHSRISIKKSVFENVVINYLDSIKFDTKTAKILTKIIRHKWDLNNIDMNRERKNIELILTHKRNEQEKLLEGFTKAHTQDFQNALELRHSKLQQEIIELESKLSQNVNSDFNIDKCLEFAVKLMEQPKEIVENIDSTDIKLRLAKSFFKELPTYEDLVNGTAKLSCIFALKNRIDTSKVEMVSQGGFEPPTPCLKGRCSNR